MQRACHLVWQSSNSEWNVTILVCVWGIMKIKQSVIFSFKEKIIRDHVLNSVSHSHRCSDVAERSLDWLTLIFLSGLQERRASMNVRFKMKSWEHLKNTIIIKDKPSQKSSTFIGVRTDPGQRQSNWVKFSLFNYSFVAHQYQPAKEKRIIELWALLITTEGKERRKEWGAWPAVFTDICLKILHVVLFVALDLLYVVVGFEWKTCFWTSFWNWSFSPIQQAKISKVTRKHAIFYSSTQISLFQYLLTIWLFFQRQATLFIWTGWINGETKQALISQRTVTFWIG